MKYDETFGDLKRCECGHDYHLHFNPETGESWGCIFEHSCDCKEFRRNK